MKIYLITNKENNKVYVGKTERSIQTRWRAHIKAAKSGSPFRFHKAIRKHGVASFVVQELCSADTENELDTLECLFTLLCRSTDFSLGYNSVVGGGPSAYNRKCTSAFMKAHPERWPSTLGLAGTWKTSEDIKKQMSISRRGSNNANAKLNDRQADAIRRNPADLSIDELATLYKVCSSTIDKVRSGELRPQYV
jgi:group I intron endonuclease